MYKKTDGRVFEILLARGSCVLVNTSAYFNAGLIQSVQNSRFVNGTSQVKILQPASIYLSETPVSRRLQKYKRNKENKNQLILSIS